LKAKRKKLSPSWSAAFNQTNDTGKPTPKKGNSMKANQLATLILRLLGIYCLIEFVPMAQLANTAIFFGQHDSNGSGMATVIVIVLFSAFWLAVGILLIACSAPLGKMLTPKETDHGNIATVSFEQIQILAFAVAGVLIFAEALPQLLSNAFDFFRYLILLKDKTRYPDTGWPFNRFGILTAIGAFLKALLGLWLFFGAHGFAKFWRSLRTFGTPKPPQE